jgi:hypothetical protein
MATHSAQREIHRNLAGRAHNIQIGCDRGYVDEIIGPKKKLDHVGSHLCRRTSSSSEAKRPPKHSFHQQPKACAGDVYRVIQKRADIKWKYQEILTEIWEYLGKCHIYLNLSTTI